ncbi:MAG: hypothetical protein QOE45_3031 [Frankiaceae bacterium]|nr:hypothetical protein [Frankiaceae bacterium]
MARSVRSVLDPALAATAATAAPGAAAPTVAVRRMLHRPGSHPAAARGGRAYEEHAAPVAATRAFAVGHDASAPEPTGPQVLAPRAFRGRALRVAPPRGAGRSAPDLAAATADVIHRTLAGRAGAGTAATSSREPLRAPGMTDTFVTGGTHVTTDGERVLYRSVADGAVPDQADAAAPVTRVEQVPTALGRWQIEEIVDTVVERIERRVVDELERRGRRHAPGVF